MQDKLNEFRIALFGGDVELAERIALGCLSMFGESALWFNELGQLYYSQGRFAEALQSYDRAACLDPWFVEPLLNGAIVLSDLGFYEEAKMRFQAASELDSVRWNTDMPQKPLAASLDDDGVSASRRVSEKIIETAELYLNLGRLDDAEAELQRARGVCDSAQVRMALARVHLLRGEATKALGHLEEARKMEPRNADVHLVAAQCYLLQKRELDAREALEKAELLSSKSSTGAVLRSVFGT